MSLKPLFILACCAAVLVLSACPTPISQDMLNHVTDEFSPVVVILSPDDGSYCAKSVIITGMVTDSSTDDGEPGRVAALRYEVMSSTVGEEIIINDDGSFSFGFSTVNFGSNFVLKVIAEDWNGNSGEATLNLQKLDGDDIPSFSVTAGSGEVTLSWDDIPNTSSYTLYYTTDGATPSVSYGLKTGGVTSPYNMTSLENGAMHVFQLCAHTSIAGGEDSWSGYKQTIPLSPETLHPVIIPGTGELTVTWPEIQATETFEVWRSRNDADGYIRIANQNIGNVFTDRQVSDTGGYFYKIKPAQDGCPFSASGYGVPSIFPLKPEIVNSFDTIGNYAYATAISGDYLFVSEGTAGLRIMDISDSASPVELKTVALGAASGQYAFNAAVGGSYAFVANGYEGLQIIDIDPLPSAEVVKQVKFGSLESARDVALDWANGFAYVADNQRGFLIIDIRDIDTNINNVGYYKTIAVTAAEAVALNGNYAYVAGSAGVSVIDLVNTADPSGAVIDNTISAVGANDVYIAGEMLHITTDSSTDEYEIWDISTPTAPVNLSTINIDIPNDSAVGVTVAGGYAYIAAENAGVQIVNIGINRGGLLYPAVIKTIVGTSSARGCAVSGEHLYVADSLGVKVVNIAEPSRAVTLTAVSTAGTSCGIEVKGDYAYIADYGNGLVIMDISNPLSPSLVRTVDTEGNAWRVALNGNYAFVADWSSGVAVIDVSDPSAAAVVDTIETSGYTDRVRISGDYLYASAFTAGVQIFDISDPESAVLVKTVDVDDQVMDIRISGHYLYIADETEGVQIVDIEVPSAAKRVNNIFNDAVNDYDGTAVSLLIHDRYLFIGASTVVDDDAAVLDSSVLVYDISDPEGVDSIEYAYPVRLYSSFNDIHISGDYIYVSAGGGPYGLQILDIADLTRAGFIALVPPFEVSPGSYGTIYDSFVVDNHVFCAAGSAGLQVMDLKPW